MDQNGKPNSFAAFDDVVPKVQTGAAGVASGANAPSTSLAPAPRAVTAFSLTGGFNQST